MNKPFPGGDTLPWYRQFWPWFLISLPATVVVAGLSTWYIADRHADDLVVDDYYKNGLAINRQLEKKQRAEDQNISAQLAFSGGAVSVQIDGPVATDELQLLLSHPLEADREIGLTLGADTLFSPSLFAGFGLEGPFLDEGIYLELSGGYDYELENSGVILNAGAALGYEAGDNVVETGFSHLTLSVGAAYSIGTLSLNYVVETDDEVLLVDEDFYVSFGVAI